jgi:hypothetical protein
MSAKRSSGDEARRGGDIAEADRLQCLRWQTAMGMIINSENTKKADGRQIARAET